MERFIASKGGSPFKTAKVRLKSPKRVTLIRYGVTPNWYMLRPELDPHNDSREEVSGVARQGFFEG